MFSKTFDIVEDVDYGEIGLKPAWIRESNAGQGSLICHDMFEHAATARHGAAEEELMAIGAAYRIRGENGFFQSGYLGNQTSDVLSNDVSAILTDLSRHERSRLMAEPRRTYKLKDEQAEFVCQTAARKGIQKAITGWLYFYEGDRPMESANGFDSWVIGEFLDGNYTLSELHDIVVGWIRIGYTNAGRRFPEVDLYGLAYMYKGVGESVNRLLDEAYLGRQVRITVDLKRVKYKVKLLDAG